MSRIELDAIQNKLKTAIQNHQMLVKTKGDQQNVAFKSCLKELQEEIKRLSEEQKKIVVKLRESLVKSSSQSQTVQQAQTTSVVGDMSTLLDPQTVTAISQSRLVYPQQGGAVLPVGMVAVPLAHMQRPALGVTFNAGRGQICTPANITLQPGDYANAVAAAAAAAQLPSSINIPINSVNSNNNIALQNSIAINNITNAINVSTLNGNLVNGSINIAGLNNAPNINNLNTIIGSGVTAHPLGSIVIGSKTLTQLNNNNNVALTTVVNSQAAILNTTLNGSGAVKQPNALASCPSNGAPPYPVISANGSSNSQSVTTHSIPSPATNCMTVVSHLSTIPTVAKDEIANLQPPHQQQKQKQHLVEAIQIPQTSSQRHASTNSPIKVPHYTASPIRSAYCSIAPAPGPPSLPAHPSIASAVPVVSASKKPEAVKPHVSTITTLKSAVDAVKPAKTIDSSPQQNQSNNNHNKALSAQEDKKRQFLKALDLYAPDMLKDLLYKRNERKRRTTANPHYSIGFQSHRWQRTESLTDVYPFKKAKVGKEKKTSKSNPSDKRDRMSDSHDDFCAACGKGGQLLMCETCRLVYHLDCLKPPLTEAPKYAWSCPKCLVSGKGSANLTSEALSRVHAYIGKRIAKEDERKKLQRKGAEIRNEKSFLDSRSKKLETDMKDQHESKRKLDEKEKVSKKELDQLSVLVQSVRDNHSKITSPVIIMGASPSVVMPSLNPERLSTSDHNLPPPSLHVPPLVSTDKSHSADNTDCVMSEEEKSQNQIDSIIGEDRIVLEFKVSAEEFREIESDSLRNNTNKSVSHLDDSKAATTKSSPESIVESVIVSTISTSSSIVSISLPSASLSSSSPTVNSCNDSSSWKPAVVITEHQLSVSS